MAKKIAGYIKLQIPAGKANPAPPVGPALGQAGVNIMGFCKEFNARTADQAGLIIPVEISKIMREIELGLKVMNLKIEFSRNKKATLSLRVLF